MALQHPPGQWICDSTIKLEDVDGLNDSLPRISWLPFRYRSARASDVWGAGSSPSWGEWPKNSATDSNLKTTDSMLKPNLPRSHHNYVMWSMWYHSSSTHKRLPRHIKMCDVMSCNVSSERKINVKKSGMLPPKPFTCMLSYLFFLSSDGWRERFRDEHPLRGRPADGLLLHRGRDLQGEGGPHRGPPPARLQHPVRSVSPPPGYLLGARWPKWRRNKPKWWRKRACPNVPSSWLSYWMDNLTIINVFLLT